jgi:D-alanyl-D-alanine carboxypeptidase
MNTANNERTISTGPDMEDTGVNKNVQAALTEKELIRDLNDFILEQVASDEFSGAVLVAKNGLPVYKHAFGLADQASNIPNRLDTRFNIASITKVFTAIAIVQLAERGLLHFDDLVSQHLPDYPRQVAERVSIHHLLTHTSGLGNYWNDAYRARRTELRAVKDYLELIKPQPLAFTPGERFQYSNCGYVLLGAIIERVSGLCYDDYLQEFIFRPAHMNDTARYDLDRIVHKLAIGYTFQDWDGTFHPGYRTDNRYLYAVKGSPATGMYSTIHDLLKFDLALREYKLLTPEYTQMAITGKVDSNQPNTRYAYGFYTMNGNWGRAIGHGGHTLGGDANYHMYLDAGYTVVVLSNYDRPAARTIAHTLADMFTAMYSQA